jgi:hypothetical protein
MLNCIPVLSIPCGVCGNSGRTPARRRRRSLHHPPPPPEPWEVEDGPTGDELQVIARAPRSGCAREWRARRGGGRQGRRSHREPTEAAGGPTFNGRSRQRREDSDVAVSDGAEERQGGVGGGGDGGGGDGGGDGGAGGGAGSRKRPLQGGAERPGSIGAAGERDGERPAGGAVGAGGGAADGGD